VIARTLRSRLLISSIILVVALLLGCFGIQVSSHLLPVEMAYNTESLIRLHVLAHSDLPSDQELKLQVRDAIIAQTSDLFAGITTKAEAWQQLNLHKDALRTVAQNIVEQSGQDYSVEIRLGKYDFPERTYRHLLVPAGEYQAMQVVIGEGKGKNWWCVLFPPLCFMEGAGTEEAIVRRKSNDTDQAQQVVVEWRLKYLDGLYREYGEKLAAVLGSVWGRRLLSTAQLPAQVLLRQ